MSDVLELAQQLISLETTQKHRGHIDAALNHIRRLLSDFTVEYFESNSIPSLLVYKQSTRPSSFDLLLNGHLDVVSGNPEQFIPQIQGNRLYGRGAADMKAALATMVYAFKNSARQTDKSLGLQIVCDEEIGGYNGTKYQLQHGVKSRFAIMGEITNLDIDVAEKGILQLELISRGRPAHGAYLWRGENALNRLMRMFALLLQKYPEPTDETWQTTVNIAKMSAGDAINQVPDVAIAYLDVRLGDTDSLDTVFKYIQSLDNEVEINIVLKESAHRSDVDTEEYRKLVKCVADVSPESGKQIKKFGGSDARFYSENKLNAVCFGPIGSNQHGPDEWVDIESLETYRQILETYIRQL